MDSDLPLIESCAGCGACCLEQESPPGYAMLLSSREAWIEPGPFAEDLKRLQSLPESAMRELREYLARLFHGSVPSDPACIWLDPSTLQCRYYEHRPSICRELELGSEGCRSWREVYDVDIGK